MRTHVGSYIQSIVDIAFDTAKDAANRDKHGVSLAFGAEVFRDEDHLILSSHRLIDGEDRSKAIGLVDGKLWTAIYVMRGQVFRFISVRRSNDGERQQYDRA